VKKEIFSRGVRMIHQFGRTEQINDPMQSNTFDLPKPNLSRLAEPSPGCEVQGYGERNYRDATSPIQKPSGAMADMNGPAPDFAELYGRPVPVGTKRRLGPPSTDK
jgi:hypothetical protein